MDNAIVRTQPCKEQTMTHVRIRDNNAPSGYMELESAELQRMADEVKKSASRYTLLGVLLAIAMGVVGATYILVMRS